MRQAYLSIGSNIDRDRNIRSAMAELRTRWPDMVFSTVYETAAVGFEGEDFYNLVASFRAEEPLENVLDTLRELEDAHGRHRAGEKFSARTLDLDLLLWGDAVLEGDPVTLPRDEILRFDFVLRPLAELAPEARHPVNGECFRDLWAGFTGHPSIRRSVPLAD
ncbi:MAG: 2-amino-4-hydroxy-6-hydroxymethyldihydropteridine diphosphokinase [Halorhodospira halophila]|uniref:2-amino-4-hydroxy-6- hydroxymethyldihydropteridine diphosphokinase n=1 Tax=Halorhodospira TaxID=85108 RepID=UPI001912105C|nr:MULTISPECIES: 2-amino-4-hydroxy-6-hydroxymethyldihydropteridine diphosphokinase [Halorhodospira]MBK5944653.1 2-amino-4-hydroxy-6-hydroxymethyldihydropteridine diphosphokinase [Halorhodospira halophila]MCC3751528.1 2-amino-4-hydroxy-6-hydroxymethyldihydropteridine diphosphokinase [Halorhodospira halophila]MCG5527204.1 2-amino-4-hydroxy-6-hydroxymethyldihydropteridine diphosphokinase [Halorhodospira halophila]MCG5532569.1 2-amino-4-hydroxy-6-hydroxymethyldihydropteridine diphosphokinase [Halor